ncbi:hypothetical protein TrCOL_g911 [Triparma columacea]|uniref:EXS domain-containing protein n=1 Tax=Triparma columacea TaxID=722753 RepID=A0A9W7G2Y9_9STRA|nr:hypothetical protein TrCOL_g911 [Triparma columacea]
MDWGVIKWGWKGVEWKEGRRKMKWEIGVNVALRFAWTVTLIPKNRIEGAVGNLGGVIWGDDGLGRALNLGLGVAEIGRRLMWGVGRCENEWRNIQVTEGEGEVEEWESKGMEKMEIEGGGDEKEGWRGGEMLRMKHMTVPAVVAELTVYVLAFGAATWGVAK